MLFVELQNKLFQESVSNKKYVLYFFTAVYILVIFLIIIGGYSIVTGSKLFSFWYDIGIGSGRSALVLLSIVVLPGILGRFNIKIPVTFIVTRYRRQFGILVFLLAFTHFSLVRLFSNLENLVSFITILSTFELFGLTALSLLFLLFLTSNSWSVIKLKKWWKRLHRIVYIILWLIFFHVAVQRISVWSIWIGFIAVLEVVSLVYSYTQKNRLTRV